MMIELSWLFIVFKIKSGKVYDLSVDYFVGMLSFYVLGDFFY